MAPTAGILDNEYRAKMDALYGEIAREMYFKRLRRAPWRVEVEGVVYKFSVESYAKKGSQRWLEEQQAIKDLDR